MDLEKEAEELAKSNGISKEDAKKAIESYLGDSVEVDYPAFHFQEVSAAPESMSDYKKRSSESDWENKHENRTKSKLKNLGKAIMGAPEKLAEAGSEAYDTSFGVGALFSNKGRERIDQGDVRNPTEWAAHAAMHPLDTGAQIGGKILSSPGYVYDLGEKVVSLIPGIKINPTRAGETIEKGLEQTAKSVGLEPAKSKGQNAMNEIAAAVLGMPFSKTIGSNLNKVGKVVEKAGTAVNAEKLGKHAGRIPKMLGSFFEAGSNIRNPSEVATTIGAVGAPHLMAEEDRKPWSSFAASVVGGKLAGSGFNKLVNKFSDNSKAFRESGLQVVSPKQEMAKLYREYGVPYKPYNASDNVGIHTAAKVLEGSFFGGDVRKAMEQQKEAISQKITPNFNQDISRSDIADKVTPHFKEWVDEMQEEYTQAFRRIGDNIREKTSGVVPLKKTGEYISDLINREYSSHPSDIQKFLVTPVGQEVQKLMKDQLKDILQRKAREEMMKRQSINSPLADVPSNTERKLFDIWEKLESNPAKERVTVNGVEFEIDPVLRDIIKDKELKNLVLNPKVMTNLPVQYVMNTLHDLGESFGGSYISKRDQGRARKLWSSLKEDLESSVGAELRNADPREYKFYRDTFENYSKFNKDEKNLVNSLMNNANDPIGFANQLVSSNRRDGKKSFLASQSLPAEDRQWYLDMTNRLLGSAGQGNNQQFNPSTWNKRFKNMDKVTRGNLYGRELGEYKKMSQIVSDLEKVQKIENTSGSGKYVINVTEGMAAVKAGEHVISNLMDANFSGAAASLIPIAAPYLINKGLTSDKLTKLLLKLDKTNSERDFLNVINGLTNVTTSKALLSALRNIGSLVRMAK